jgi:hypothetical protein
VGTFRAAGRTNVEVILGRTVVSLSLFAACSATTSPKTVALAPPAPASAPAPVAAPTVACRIEIGAPRAIAIPPRLQAVAPQYFHAGAHDDGFNDLVPGTSRYQWYDPSNLDVAVDPPGDIARIARSTSRWFFGYATDGSLRVARRSDSRVAPVAGKPGYDLDMIETGSYEAWIALADLSQLDVPTVRVVRVDATLASRDWTLTMAPQDPFDRRFAWTEDGRVGFVWVAQGDGRLSVVASWLGPSGFGAPNILDSVAIPAPAIELSLRSTTNLRVTPEGRDRVAVAWRPLVPAPGEVVDVGTRARPPEKAVRAEVRIFAAAPSSRPTPPDVHDTTALPLGGVTGIGFWPLAGNGMAATTVSDHAVFFWNDSDGSSAPRVVYASPGDARAKAITPGRYRIVPRAADLLLLQSVGPQQVVPLYCR